VSSISTYVNNACHDVIGLNLTDHHYFIHEKNALISDANLFSVLLTQSFDQTAVNIRVAPLK